MRYSKVVAIFFIFALGFPLISSAAECSDGTKASMANALAAREEASIKLQIALANRQVEATYQSQLTVKVEEKYTSALPASSYMASIRPLIRAILEKKLEKERATRTKESERALAKRQRAVELAQKKFDRAFDRVPTSLDCTL